MELQKKYSQWKDVSTIDRAYENSYCLGLIDKNTYNYSYVYNYYTGIGGLSGEKFAAHANFAAYTAAKKEYENGQFFTPEEVIENILHALQIQDTDKVLDPTCGKGNFFNYIKEENCMGIEFEGNAAKVAKYLYPKANIIEGDFLNTNFEEKADVALCNPPFNLRWYYEGQERSSQEVFMMKLAGMVKPAAMVALIVPASWLKDEFFYKNTIADIAENFAYIGGYNLDDAAFNSVGVSKFATKVLFFQRLGAGVSPKPYTRLNSYDNCVKLVVAANSHRLAKSSTIAREIRLMGEGSEARAITAKLCKMLFELQTHAKYTPFFMKAVDIINDYKAEGSAKRPSHMTQKEFEESKTTPKQLLKKIKGLFKKAEKEEALIKAAQEQGVELKDVEIIAPTKNAPSAKTLRRKERGYALSRTSFEDIPSNVPNLQKWVGEFTFIGGKNTACKFNEKQAHDFVKILQKPYALLSWEQGSGKTGVGHARAEYLRRAKITAKTVILSTATSIKITWKNHLKRNNASFIIVEKWEDIFAPVDYLLISFTSLTRKKSNTYKTRVREEVKEKFTNDKGIEIEKTVGYKYKTVMQQGSHAQKLYMGFRELVKKNDRKVCIVVDESDEMTNNTSLRTRQAFSAFQHCKYKLLMTGTATRNNISELFPQLQFMYNNSPAFINECILMYDQIQSGENKGQMITTPNFKPGEGIDGAKCFEKLGQPFSFKNGQNDFRRCFNPVKATVLGIQKQNQDLFNADELKKVCSFSMIVRTFNDVAGPDKYKFASHVIEQTWQEAALYEEIFSEVQRLISEFNYATGNARKDAALRLQYQMRMLIDACSIPQKFKSFAGYGGKTTAIINFCTATDKPILLGCLTKYAVKTYDRELTASGKNVFIVTGATSVKRREAIVKEFQETENSVLVCTQQALKSSINIPNCATVVCESLQWNLPKLAQFYFRCIRFDSTNPSTVHFFLMRDSIEENLMALLMDKQRLNEFVKTGALQSKEEIFGDMGIEVFNRAITKTKDADDKTKLAWGRAKNEGEAADGKDGTKLSLLPAYWSVKNAAGNDVIGEWVYSCIETKKVGLELKKPDGTPAKVVLFDKEKLKESSPLRLSRYLAELTAKLKAEKEKAVQTA